jgi:hypothetical protein
MWGSKAYEFSTKAGNLLNNLIYHWSRKTRFSAGFTILALVLQAIIIPIECITAITYRYYSTGI